MEPDAGGLRYRLAVAPRFAVAPSWASRVACNGGVEGHGTRAFRARADWAPPDAAALAALVAEVPDRDAVLPPTHLGLVVLPERLRRGWWAQAERSGGLDGPCASFDTLFSEIVEFLRFKRMPLPDRVSLEVAVSAPGMPSARPEAEGVPAGLGFGDRPATPDLPPRAPLGLVNLGDEATFVVLLDRPPAALAALLETSGVSGVRGLSPRGLVERFFATFPEQPLLRLRLDPGEGVWLSPLGVVHDGWTAGKRDVDVMLVVGGELSPATA